jgi:catechol 2,3-dioxygenase-like lactoylglutathione lyase family enzyme
MIDHISISVTDFERSKKFYQQLLGSIGYELMAEFPASVTGSVDVCGFGEKGKPDFWLSAATTAPRQHIAFGVESRALVDAFHAAGLAAGGRDNGAAGPRPQYHPNYYGSFILDPDGHNVEAVCHRPA